MDVIPDHILEARSGIDFYDASNQVRNCGVTD